MEPDVIRMYSSSPPPLEDGAEEDDDEFGDFGGFSGVPNSVSFTEFDTPAIFNQNQALSATSPPELLNNGGVVGVVGVVSNLGSAPASRGGPTADDPSRSNGVLPGMLPPGGDIAPLDRTVHSEELRKHADHSHPNRRSSNSPDLPATTQTHDEPADCNGQFLTNGFVTFEGRDTPPPSSCPPQPTPPSPPPPSSSQSSVHSRLAADRPPHGPGNDDFADFAAFSSADVQGHLGQVTAACEGSEDSERGADWLAQQGGCRQHPNTEQGSHSEDSDRDEHTAGSGATGSADSRSLSADTLSNGTGGLLLHTDTHSADCQQRDVTFAHFTDTAHDDELFTDAAHEFATRAAPHEPSGDAAVVCTEGPAAQNGLEESDGSEEGVAIDDGVSLNAGDGAEHADEEEEKGSGTETETETETSLGRPLSTEALEEYGDMSTTGSVPSPPLLEDMATPGDLSQLAEDDDDDADFGDFGDAGASRGQEFADFKQLVVREVQEQGSSTGGCVAAAQELADDEEFGDFDAPKCHGDGETEEEEEGEEFADFPGSDSFADFSSAPVGMEAGEDAGWSAFDEPGEGQEEAESWAAFGEEPSAAPPEKEDEEEDWQEGRSTTTAPPPTGDDACRRDSLSASLSSRLEKLFQTSFPETPVVQLGEAVVSLKTLLEPPLPERTAEEEVEEGDAPHNHRVVRGVWGQLQDIHEAFGLRHQWGGSHSNKTMLCSLGIDTRNILYTGQKKQPVIVPMYAASLGMLEPTKEPLKPVSAAEMIASIAQAPPVALETSTSPPDTAQDPLPPVQFDWSSSGLTNPLDASGGSSLLNLDFFGPVEDSGCSSNTSIPGVDPELYELTTAKMDPGASGSRVADAFARLMSTMEKTSTSTRKPTRKDEHLSEEATQVISGLPDLSFMTAKVLMFPTTLTPLGCSEPDPDP